MLHRDRDQHRPDRRRDAVRDARTDRGGRLDHLDGDAAQPRRHHPQGHPAGRTGDHREGRRRDSARGRSGRHRRRATDAAPWIMPTRCPVCGSELRQGRRRSGVAVREQLVPVEAAARPRALRVARRDEHRRHGRVAVSRCCASTTWSTATPTSTGSTPRRSKRCRGWARSPRPRCWAQIEKSKANDVWRLLYGLGIRHVGERGAQVLADHFGSVEAIESGDDRRARTGAGDRSGAGGVGAVVLRRAAQSRVDRRRFAPPA